VPSRGAVDGRTSNIGQCLWTGIVDDSVAGQVVEHLLSPAMFIGFGLRTPASDAAAYNPVSYHNGSVWPHDTVVGASGVARYGFRAEAERVVPVPVPYPTSCSPRAWAASVPYEVLRIAVGLEADVPRERFTATTTRTKQVSDG
jgi:glycogen debranching enzyme